MVILLYSLLILIYLLLGFDKIFYSYLLFTFSSLSMASGSTSLTICLTYSNGFSKSVSTDTVDALKLTIVFFDVFVFI